MPPSLYDAYGRGTEHNPPPPPEDVGGLTPGLSAFERNIWVALGVVLIALMVTVCIAVLVNA